MYNSGTLTALQCQSAVLAFKNFKHDKQSKIPIIIACSIYG